MKQIINTKVIKLAQKKLKADCEWYDFDWHELLPEKQQDYIEIVIKELESSKSNNQYISIQKHEAN